MGYKVAYSSDGDITPLCEKLCSDSKHPGTDWGGAE